MKKTLLALFTLTILLISAQLAFTYSNSAPPAAHTNAPGEANCTACHSSFSLALSGPVWNSIDLSSTVPLNQFDPATTYTFTLSINDPTISKFGFEMVALPSGAGASTASLGTFTATDPETEVVVSGSREYISHSDVGTAALSNPKVWTFDWESPSTMGDIDFYVVVNATNSSGNPTGDRIYSKVFSSTILPVKWLSYEVKAEKAGNNLKWSTASESNNLHFEIEKGFDGNSWKQIGTVKSKGNSNRLTEYSYMDAEKTNAKTYYRIRQVDMDGKFEYSKVLYAERAGSSVETFAYDPLTQKISINNPSLMSPATLFNLSGIPVCSDMYGEMLNVSALDKGIYVLKMPSGAYQKIYIY